MYFRFLVRHFLFEFLVATGISIFLLDLETNRVNPNFQTKTTLHFHLKELILNPAKEYDSIFFKGFHFFKDGYYYLKLAKHSKFLLSKKLNSAIK
jgi:hypothetical protein